MQGPLICTDRCHSTNHLARVRDTGVTWSRIRVTAIPESMNALRIVGGRSQFALAPSREATPIPSSAELLIEVHAAGVNGHDVHQIHNGGHELRLDLKSPAGLQPSGQASPAGPSVTGYARCFGGADTLSTRSRRGVIVCPYRVHCLGRKRQCCRKPSAPCGAMFSSIARWQLANHS